MQNFIFKNRIKKETNSFGLVWQLVFLALLSCGTLSGFAQEQLAGPGPTKPKGIAGANRLMENPKLFWKFFESDNRVQARNTIDTIVADGMKIKKLTPSPLCNDAVFIRRVYYDLTGFPPSFTDAYNFLRDTDKNKRAKLIDKLLDSKDYIDYRTMLWCDMLRVKSEFPINLWPNGTMIYYRWLRDRVRLNTPWTDMCRELILADGSNFRVGPSNFYRAVNPHTPEGIADAVVRFFLGTRLTSLTSEQQKDMIALFSRITIKKSAEWKEEITYWTRQPLDKKNFKMIDSSTITVDPEQDPREVFANWLIREDNHQFNYTIVNRLWYWLFGRGIVQEPDDFRKGNPPVYPELFNFLERELLLTNYDMKHITRLILNSHTYQQSSIARLDYGDEEKYFASYPIRRHPAEILQDTFIKIFDIKVTYKSEVPEPFTYIPDQIRTAAISDSGITNSFLETFGRASRDSGLMADRNNKTSQSQQLFFLNSTEMNNWTKNLIAQINNFIPSGKNDRAAKQDQLMNVVWMTLLSRLPTPPERIVLRQTFGSNRDWTREDVHDIIWAVVNTKEFLCQH
ncbi:MAG: DUF1553 domain-containing protein [Planctomycetia bacterium]|nr:DUF1553 domain-containing protein [Planctomycetia bacterium]